MLNYTSIHKNMIKHVHVHIYCQFITIPNQRPRFLLTRNDVVKASDRTYTHVPVNATNVLALLRPGDDLLLKTRPLLLRHTPFVARTLRLVDHHKLPSSCQ